MARGPKKAGALAIPPPGRHDRAVPPRPRVAYLAYSDQSGPTSRYRIYQFRRALEAAGVDLEVLPAFDASWFAAERHRGMRRWLERGVAGTRAAVRRGLQIRHALAADGLIIERESFPWGPPVIEWLATRLGRGYVLELDDAMYLARGRRWKYDAMLARARAVISGNATIAAHATSRGLPAHVVPTVVDTELAITRRSWGTLASPPRLGWVGLASNIPQLASIRGALAAVCAATGARIEVVSARRPTLGLPVDFVPWHEAEEAARVSAFDVGLMPLLDTPFTRGKCGLKILQYMAAGVPVVASPIGVNREIITHGENGLLASTETEWRAAVSSLLGDATLRERLARAGLHTVERRYSLKVWGPRVGALYRQLFAGER